MKNLRIEYDGIVLFDGPIMEIAWSDSENGVQVAGKIRKSPQQGGGAGLLDLLTGRRQQQTAAMVSDHRAVLAEEKRTHLEQQVNADDKSAI